MKAVGSGAADDDDRPAVTTPCTRRRRRYGSTLDRTGACYDTNKAVLVKITDACPCKYDSNAYR